MFWALESIIIKMKEFYWRKRVFHIMMLKLFTIIYKNMMKFVIKVKSSKLIIKMESKQRINETHDNNQGFLDNLNDN